MAHGNASHTDIRGGKVPIRNIAILVRRVGIVSASDHVDVIAIVLKAHRAMIRGAEFISE